VRGEGPRTGYEVWDQVGRQRASSARNPLKACTAERRSHLQWSSEIAPGKASAGRFDAWDELVAGTPGADAPVGRIAGRSNSSPPRHSRPLLADPRRVWTRFAMLALYSGGPWGSTGGDRGCTGVPHAARLAGRCRLGISRRISRVETRDMVKPLQLGHANIRVRDVERATKFYTEVLGLEVTHRRRTKSS
jgi:hypothetical protein